MMFTSEQPLDVFYKKVAFKNFAKFTGKQKAASGDKHC